MTNIASDNFKASIKEKDLEEGKMKHVQVSGKSILLVRQGGQIFAVSNICPHAGCSLDKGLLYEYLVMCPCHGWKFDVRNGQYVDSNAIILANYRCKVENGKIFIEIADKDSKFF